MTEVRVTSEEYAQLYSIYFCAKELVNHETLEDMNEIVLDSKNKMLKEAVDSFKNEF